MYDTKIIENIGKKLIAANQTICVAESVTSGHLQAALSLANNASGFFQGGITAYNLGQKARHLQVNPIHATSCNSVSQVTADEMALNALKLFSADWSIGITGYASPLPEMGIKDLFSFYSIACAGTIVHRGRIRSDEHDPLRVQVFYANHALRALNDYLQSATGNSSPVGASEKREAI